MLSVTNTGRDGPPPRGSVGSRPPHALPGTVYGHNHQWSVRTTSARLPHLWHSEFSDGDLLLEPALSTRLHGRSRTAREGASPSGVEDNHRRHPEL